MSRLPDDALVIRGGLNLAKSFLMGSGAIVAEDGKLNGVSVNSVEGMGIDELTRASTATGYPGIMNNQVGVTTVGAIRELGGDVTPSPSRTNPFHATLSGLTAEQASQLFRPTRRNPSRPRI